MAAMGAAAEVRTDSNSPSDLSASLPSPYTTLSLEPIVTSLIVPEERDLQVSFAMLAFDLIGFLDKSIPVDHPVPYDSVEYSPDGVLLQWQFDHTVYIGWNLSP